MARVCPGSVTSPREGPGWKLETWDLSCWFSTLPVDEYSSGKEARGHGEGAAGHTDGIKARDVIFWISAHDASGGAPGR